MNPGATQREPWRDSEVILVAVTAVIGVTAIGGGWFGSSRTDSLVPATVWLNLAVAGFVIAAAGNCVWLLRLRRAVGERRISLISLDIAPPQVGATPESRGTASRSTQSTATFQLVRVTGTTKVHFADCPLVSGKRLEAAAVGDGQPCGVCAR